MTLNQAQYDVLSQFGDVTFQSAFALDVTGSLLVALVIQGIVFYAILLLFENRHVFQRAKIERKREAKKALTAQNQEDENISDEFLLDVETEEDFVLAGQCDREPVVVKKLRKEFGGTKNRFIAVKGFTFHVPKDYCFGLLRVNGASKTTTFQMLTGDILPTGGEAALAGYDVVTHLNGSRKNLGYCPQFDALDELLTVREHIKFYAMLRGIRSEEIKRMVDDLTAMMELKMYARRQTGTLSEGNKRKLQTAIALIGDPQIVFLDEPTAGMDPKAKRRV